MAANSRLSALRRLARRRKCTHILVSDPIDCEYLCGFHASNIQLLVSSRAALLFTDFRYRTAAEAFCRANPPWELSWLTNAGMSSLKAAVGSDATVGIQSDILTIDAYDRLRGACRGTKFVKIKGAISDLFSVKQPSEIKALRRGASIGDRAFAQLLKELRVGMTELQTARRLEELCRLGGADEPSFATIVLFGSRAALPHGSPGKRRLRLGDWVLCDFGCRVQGLCSDMTRTVVFGRATHKQREIYEIVRRAQALARKAVRAGVAASTVDHAARVVIEQAGYGDAFGHATGHGVGRRVHEGPRLSGTDTRLLRSGMVVTVEPGIYIAGSGGVRIEDMMLVNDDNARSLTASPRSLIEIQA